MIKEKGLQKIGMFAKPHGVKGEISLITDYDIASIAGDPFIVCDIDGIRIPFFIASYRQKSTSSTLLTFENLDSEEKVKFLTGKLAYVTSELLPLNDERPVSLDGLVGYTITDDQIGTLGKVIDVDDNTPNVLLTVDYKGNEILVPLALMTSIQHNQQVMHLSLPEGFLDI